MRKHTKTNWAKNRNTSPFWIERRAKYIWTQASVMGTREEGGTRGNWIRGSAVEISLVLQITSLRKEPGHTGSCSLSGFCGNLPKSFWNAHYPQLRGCSITFKSLSFLFSFLLFLPLTCKFNLPVNPSPNPLSFRGKWSREGGAGSKVTSVLSWTPLLSFY